MYRHNVNTCDTLKIDEGRVDAICSSLNYIESPGIGIGISVAGTPVYRKCFGLANCELPLVLSPSTRMRIYSITKHFVCLAYLLLCEDGKAKINDPIDKYVPEIHPASRGVTVRQLMTHTGGLLDAGDVRWHLTDVSRQSTVADAVAMYRKIAHVNFRPGSAWCYSNDSYLLLTVAIERISDQSIDDLLRNRVFIPAGMYDTALRRSYTDLVPNSATPHIVNDAGKYERTPLRIELAGEGGIASTVDDMLRWLAQMDAPVVGDRDTWTMMTTPEVLIDGGSTEYGLGLYVGKYRKSRVIAHSGGSWGGSSQIVKIPGLGIDVVVISNRDDINAPLLTCRILESCLSAPEGKSANAGNAPAQGVFRSRTTNRIIQLYEGGEHQTMSVNGGGSIELRHGAKGELHPANELEVHGYSVALMGDGVAPASVRLCECGKTEEFERVVAAPADMGAILGEYYSQDIEILMKISPEGRDVALESDGPFGKTRHRLVNVGSNLWQVSPEISSFREHGWGSMLEYNAERDQVIWRSGYTWGLQLDRKS